jgi:hypothetical protein
LRVSRTKAEAGEKYHKKHPAHMHIPEDSKKTPKKKAQGEQSQGNVIYFFDRQKS